MAQVDNYKWLGCIPKGWEELARQMIQECEAINPTYTIEDLKEKFGSLRVYSYIKDYNDDDWMIPSCNDEEIGKIEEKYEAISVRTCCQCGAPAVKYSTGWILPWCDKCGDEKEQYYEKFTSE